MSVETADSIVEQLQALAREYLDLKETAAVYAALLPIIQAADLPVAPLALTPDQARDKLESRVPLLQGVPLTFEAGAACELMVGLAHTLEEVPEHSTGQSLGRRAAARRIRRFLERGDLKASVLLRRVRAGNRAAVVALAEAWQLDADLLWRLAQHALTPALRAWQRQLAPLVGQVDWPQSTCFVCGAEALLGEWREPAAEKHLRCGQCGADWVSPLRQCAFCGNADDLTLGHIDCASQRSDRQVEICEACKGYLKVITTAAPIASTLLPVQDLATVHLDYAAQERGYVRGGQGIKISPVTVLTSVRSLAAAANN